jgi:hypothetical protein
MQQRVIQYTHTYTHTIADTKSAAVTEVSFSEGNFTGDSSGWQWWPVNFAWHHQSALGCLV